ncbi:MAG: hypothetical protein U0T83_01145 [Bacteriovoracaceae bacterium]
MKSLIISLILLFFNFSLIAKIPIDITEEELTDAKRLRKMLADAVHASNRIDVPFPYAYREVIANHPDVFHWIAEGKDLRRIFLAAEIPEVSNELFNVLKTANEMINANFLTDYWYKNIQEFYLRQTIQDRILYLNLIPDQKFLELQNFLDTKIQAAKFAEDSNNLNVSKKLWDKIKRLLDVAEFKLVKPYLNYVDQLPISTKKKIYENLLRAPPHQSKFQKFKIIVNTTKSGFPSYLKNCLKNIFFRIKAK